MTASTLRSALTVVVAVVLASSVASVGAAQTHAQPGAEPTTVDSCTTITEPGVYELSDNLTNATANTTLFEFDGVTVTGCVVIASDDVVFDGNGYSVVGANAIAGLNETTVSVANQTTDGGLENVTVLNESNASTETNETLGVGVAALPRDGTQQHLTNVTVKNVRSTDWAAGVYVENVTKSTVASVDASGNAEVGFELSNASFTVVEEVRAADNGGHGVIVYATTHSYLTSVQAEDNGFTGFIVGESHWNKFADVSAVNQSIAGVAVFNSSANAFAHVDVRQTTGESYPTTAGLLFDSASNNILTDVSAVDNRNWTYYATNGSADNVVLKLTSDGQTISFVATDVALRFDENATATGTPLVIADTSSNASILVDTTWTEALADAPDDVAVGVVPIEAIEMPDASPNATAG